MNKFICAAAAVVIASGFTVAAHAQDTPQIIINVPGQQGAQHNEEHRDHHPEIHAAMEKVQHAKEDLDKASRDYGGHRENAKKHLDAALEEMNQSIDYADHHHEEHHEDHHEDHHDHHD